MNLYKLKFSTPLKVTSELSYLGETEYIIHSDTLYGAIHSLWGWLFNEEEVFGNNLLINKFKLSSAFPYYNNMLFFPKPFNVKLQESDILNSNERKKSKKVTYLEYELLKDVINGKKISLSEVGIIQKMFACKDVKNAENLSIFKKFTASHNTLERFSDSSQNVFESTEIVFNNDTLNNIESGLFFLAEFESEEIKEKFEAVLSLLGDEGIGADRTLGKGLFNYVCLNFEIPKVDNSNAYVLLSLFLPAKNELSEINFDKSYYEIITRGGWVTLPGYNAKYKNNIKMFTEGSVFNSKNQLLGNFADISDKELKEFKDVNIWRNGLFFGFPIVLDEVNDGA
ncbi:MAG TPA: type III-A CRISPR-associated RAMP protein Csm4 [Melioribacteraceae bacterium]|nr:type III-A CRISPR-associated RAMP protein Csm4 [Melioribacteraceae bacterium]